MIRNEAKTTLIKVPKLRFPGFVGEWESSIIKKSGIQVIDGDRGEKYPNGDDFSEQGYCLFLNAKNVTKTGFVFDNEFFISDKKDKELRKGKLNRKDIVLTTRGTVGNFAFYNQYVAHENIRINSGMVILRSEIEIIDSDYLYKLLNSPRLRRQIDRLSFGSAQPQLTVKDIYGLKIGFPSSSEQQKIAGFLGVVDERIRLQQSKIDQLKKYKKSLLHSIFSQTLRFKDVEGNNYPDWQKIKLGDITTQMQSGLSRKLSSTDIGMPVIRSNNIQNQHIDVSDLSYWYAKDPQGADTKNYILIDGDLLINFINSPAQIGKFSIYSGETNRETIFTTNIMRLKFSTKTFGKFVYYAFCRNDYDNFIKSITKPAVNQASFTNVEFKRYTMCLPSLPEQQKIADFLTTFDAKITQEEKALTQAKTFKKALLQGMFV
jgi:type I restriction enzyme, S subunit